MDIPNLVPADMDARLEREIQKRIPEHCQEGLLAYLRHGRPPGHFLQAVLTNDLWAAATRADEDNRYRLWDYVFVLYNYAPSAACGSDYAVRKWIERGIAARAAAELEARS